MARNSRTGAFYVVVPIIGLSVVVAGAYALATFTNEYEFVAETIESPSNETIIVKNDPRLLPDLVPYPAQDLEIEKNNDGTHLLFTTMFYNRGSGPLELVADPKTMGIQEDIERDVLQRIYNIDGTYTDKLVGTFLWHQPHLHYHYKDFVIYDLEPIDAPGSTDLEGYRVKSTFCIRDVSKLDGIFQNGLEEAKYLICGKELQGISVGWADTYFNTYPDQRLNITDLPSGTYRLSFIVNPENILEESSLDNNVSSVEFEYNKRAGNIEILKESPGNLPAFEHIHIEQIFN